MRSPNSIIKKKAEKQGNKKRAIQKTKKDLKDLHPFSRKAKQVNKKLLSEIKKRERTEITLKNKQFETQIYTYIKANYPRDRTSPFTYQEANEFFKHYFEDQFSALDDELNGLRESNQSNRHTSKKLSLSLIRQNFVNAQNQLHSPFGLNCPDITNQKNIKKLLEWNGEDINYLTCVKLRKFSNKQ